MIISRALHLVLAISQASSLLHALVCFGTKLLHFTDIISLSSTHIRPSQTIKGDPSSLSDLRLKQNLLEVTPEQCLNTLRQIKPQTYDRIDTGERRLGLVADQCEAAFETAGVEVENVIGQRHWQVDGERDVYKTLQYERLVPLLIGAVNTLSARVQDLESATRKKRNGAAASKPLRER